MISIKTSNNFILEKKYIIKVLISKFLGLDYKIEISSNNNSNYEISLPNNKKLIVKDAFWDNITDSYLKEEYIPKSVKYVKNEFTPESDIPVLYGSDEIDLDEKHIFCGIDIFASSFFMLTRWEEFVNKTRDQHNRFSATASLAYKFDFLDRPLVNEYVEMLWNMLKHIGYEANRKQHNFEMLLTHDVDIPFRYENIYKSIREVSGDIIKRHNISVAIKNLICSTKSILYSKSDPYYTFDFLMEQSEKLGLISHFFFMGGGKTNFDEKYELNNKKIQKLAKDITTRGHIIGFHPSYEAYNNPIVWKQEKDNLEKTLNIEVEFGREHYLRFEAPFTWQIWEDSNMLWDSTLNYADHEGFRCGTCWEYHVFNFLTKQELQLVEKPLIVMEGNFFTYQKELKIDTVRNKIVYLINKCKKYNGTFVYLWHNTSLLTNDRKELYIKTLLL